MQNIRVKGASAAWVTLTFATGVSMKERRFFSAERVCTYCIRFKPTSLVSCIYMQVLNENDDSLPTKIVKPFGLMKIYWKINEEEKKQLARHLSRK